MGNKIPGTPRGKVRASLRLLWLRSRERAAARKREQNCCEECGRKETRAKGREFIVEVHHEDGAIPWETIIDSIYEHLLVDPDRLKVLCKECHHKEHE